MQVAESPPGSIGAPVPFFVRRPDATDASEALGRFVVDGLVALFQREVRSFPKGKDSWDEKKFTIIVPGPKSSSDTPPVERVEPEPPATTKKASAASKGKGGKKGETEQPSPGDDGAEAQWRAIRSEVQLNRCLVMRAGESISLATLPLFSESAGITEGRPQTEPSVQGDQGNLGGVPEGENTKAEDAPAGTCHDGVDAAEESKDINKSQENGEPATRIDRSSPFVVCLDFRLDLAEALLNVEGGDRELAEEKSGNVAGGEGNPSSDDKVVRIVSCGNNVEISAVIRLWAPIDDAPATHAEGEHSTENSGGDATAAALPSGEPSSLGPPSTDASAKSGAVEGPASATRPSGQSSEDDAMTTPTPVWYLHSLSVRSGSYVGMVPCVGPAEPVFQRQEPVADANVDADAAAGSSGSQDTRRSSRSREGVVCELAEWHALALVANNEGDDTPVVLCVDGEVLPLRQDAGVVATDSTTTFGHSELLAGGAIVMGGTGREWTALAVKNLAVYNETPGIEQLRATTRVFRGLREEQQKAKAADEKADERWLEEVRKAEEEEREPGETLPSQHKLRYRRVE